VEVVKGACGIRTTSFFSESKSLKFNFKGISKNKFHFLSFFDFKSSILIHKVVKNFTTSSIFFNFFTFSEILCNSAKNDIHFETN
jgi:hypothetical protein